MDSKTIGMNVKIARVKKNMTIQELAKKAGMSVTTISRLERGIGNARMFSINKIAEVLEVDVKTLVEWWKEEKLWTKHYSKNTRNGA